MASRTSRSPSGIPDQMGCLRRIGCLLIVVLLAYGAWVTRDRWRRWLPVSQGLRTHVVGPDTTEGVWSPVTTGGANHAEHLILTLGERSGPVFASMPPEEFAAYMLMDVTVLFRPPPTVWRPPSSTTDSVCAPRQT